MATDTITQFVTITTTDCPSCGVLFGMPDWMLARRRKDGESFYCPSGHSMSFRETEAVRLRKQLDDANASRHRMSAALTAANDQRRAEEKAHAVTKGQLTKTRNRVAKGVCPCCHRPFVALGRHMQNKHPDYLGGQGAGDK